MINAKANYIRSRLSLRRPQAESLEILQELGDVLALEKNPDLPQELDKVRERYPTCIDFERDFVSLCFALATGVGKTRLMGAFISYLYLEKGIKNFFVMAPHLTVYDKLITDFSQPTHPKYVFKGIGDFTTHPPRVVTGDNYESAAYSDMLSEVTINVFNISKLNAESRGGKEPRMKRLQECLGGSYFNHLAGLNDLVLLMDESHHYRADRGMAVINELNPILGLELTATPQVERGQRTIKFKNVVYEYSLARAIRDGFVKEPAVATRKDFDPSGIADKVMEIHSNQRGSEKEENIEHLLSLEDPDNWIEIDPEELKDSKEVITSVPVWAKAQQERRLEIEQIESEEERQDETRKLEVENTMLELVPSLNTVAKSVQDLTKPEVKSEAIRKVRSAYADDLFVEDRVKEAEERYNAVVREFISRSIEIPKIMVQQKSEVMSGFRDFDLDVEPIYFQPVADEIVRQALQSNEMDFVKGSGRIVPDRLDNILVSELLNKPEVDYDSQRDLLFKLAGQAIQKLKSDLDEKDAENVVQYRKREIADQIYSQMMPHFYLEEPEYEAPVVFGFVEILPHNFEKLTADKIHDFKETIQPTSAIPSKVFGGFQKACHSLYKFDSKTEKDFAWIVEKDKDVIKWLRPARNQFHIYYDRNTQRYVPDFVVETDSGIYLVETKRSDDIESDQVQQKARAAANYCAGATEYTTANGGKPWRYLLIPHETVKPNMGFKSFATKYAQVE